jgi:hypothetical protein
MVLAASCASIEEGPYDWLRGGRPLSGEPYEARTFPDDSGPLPDIGRKVRSLIAEGCVLLRISAVFLIFCKITLASDIFIPQKSGTRCTHPA